MWRYCLQNKASQENWSDAWLTRSLTCRVLGLPLVSQVTYYLASLVKRQDLKVRLTHLNLSAVQMKLSVKVSQCDFLVNNRGAQKSNKILYENFHTEVYCGLSCSNCIALDLQRKFKDVCLINQHSFCTYIRSNLMKLTIL